MFLRVNNGRSSAGPAPPIAPGGRADLYPDAMIVRITLEDPNLYPLLHVQMHVPAGSDAEKFLASQEVESATWVLSPNKPHSARLRLSIQNVTAG